MKWSTRVMSFVACTWLAVLLLAPYAAVAASSPP